MKGQRAVIAVLCAIVALPLAVVAVVVAARSSTGQTAFVTADQGPYRGSEPPGRNPLPSFSLRGYRGNRVTSESLHGRVVVLTFLDSHCTDACPIIASVVARTIEKLSAQERRQVKAVGITTDPRDDTPATVERFLRRRHAVGELEYLLGSEREMRRLWNAFHVLSSLETGSHEVHSAPVRIYSRDGLWVATLHAGADLTESNLLHDIRTALESARSP